MIPPFSFLGFPRNPYQYYPNYYNMNVHRNNLTPYTPSNSNNLNMNKSYNYNNYEKNNNFDKKYNTNTFEIKSNIDNKSNNPNNSNTSNYSNDFFEIFGFKFSFDDILIICLLFFLYQEDVKDNYLYMALILLLLS